VRRLKRNEIDTLMKAVPKWSLSADATKIHRHIEFKDFNQAFGFMTRVAITAEKVRFNVIHYKCSIG
jgi:4a-hydroxytetrahydrobiopterin dehydratase